MSERLRVDEKDERFELVEKLGEQFVGSLEDYDDVHIYKFQDFDPQWLKVLLKFGEKVFGEDAYDAFGIVSQIYYGNVFILQEQTDDTILGIACFNRAWDDRKLAYLSDYAISEDARGNDFGTRFLGLVLENLKDQGIARVRLTVDVENVTAINLYKKLGFAIMEEFENFYGEGMHRYIMQKRLVSKDIEDMYGE
ncbi:GNAT family N-acetyltransferase [Peptoniphilus sp. KCTC 25270]|uniref:GNAT family N-acetyltransferase n=1 Tax=Peptoniphilus sp. KCTC 25270 TaxID=2897414 RepID=UPI001E5126B9|nr:GNAT family N-acetyltransferase [Peptoniphilus sp. KCTC 25270]MCD1147813.1 GNAT family N-acetyltransferase [Peptoniphilus sp. KCTC 25270]